MDLNGPGLNRPKIEKANFPTVQIIQPLKSVLTLNNEPELMSEYQGREEQ
jgi:hypothetical protein